MKRRLLSLPLGILAAVLSTSAVASDMEHHQHAMHSMDAHAEHAKMLAAMGDKPVYQRSEHAYRAPEITLVDSSNTPRSLDQMLDADQPVILSFIYTSCTTICPVLSATLAEAQPALMNAEKPPQLVSISIDPTYDTPERLKSYAEKYQAGPKWHFLTGDTAAIVQAQRAFDAYRGDKSNHIPLTLIRPAGTEEWVRIEGFTSAADLVREYERVASR